MHKTSTILVSIILFEKYKVDMAGKFKEKSFYLGFLIKDSQIMLMIFQIID